MRVPVPALLVVLALAGCGGKKSALAEQPSQDLAGHYEWAPGESWFTPCGGAPAAWVTVADEAAPAITRAKEAGTLGPGKRAFVRWRAAAGTGPVKPGAQTLLVREVLELRPAAAADCGQR